MMSEREQLEALYVALYAATQHDDAVGAVDVLARCLREIREHLGYVQGHPLDALASRLEDIAASTCAERRLAIARAVAEHDRDPRTIDWIDDLADFERT